MILTRNRRSGLATATRLAALMIAACVIVSGCSGISLNKKSSGKGADSVVYQVTQDEALELSHWAVTQALPSQKIHPLKKPRVGYFVSETNQPGHYRVARFKETTYIYELDLIKVRGNTDAGDPVTGYTYAIKGDGDLKSGPEKLALLEKKMFEAFDQSGRAIAVVEAQPTKASGPPKLSKEVPPALTSPPPAVEKSKPPVLAPAVVPVPEKPTAKEAPAPSPPAVTESLPDEDEAVFIKLKKLKELRDQGIITEEEFKAKKKELLDRI